MSHYLLQWPRLTSLIGVLSILASPIAARAETPFTHGNVQAVRNRVEVLLNGGIVRPARDQDRLGRGDAIRTNLASQADLQLNDGSLVRLGESTTFWVVPATRNLWLVQGTGLLQLAAEGGTTQIETPSAIAQAQGATTVVVRHVQLSDASAQAAPGSGNEDFLQNQAGRTAVMVLSDPERGGVQVSLRGERQVELMAGQMAIIDGDNLYLFEFNRELFYQTSSLAQGLFSPDEIWSEETEGIDSTTSSEVGAESADLTGGYWLDPRFLSPNGDATGESGWLFPATSPNPAPTAESNPAPVETDDSTTSDSTNLPEPAIADPNTSGGTTHNDFDVEQELTPAPTEPSAEDDSLPAPSESNPESLNIPAGVIAPPSESLPPEVPSETNAPAPLIEPSSTEGNL